MMPSSGERIIRLVAQNDPWSALGLSRKATPDDVFCAHLKLHHRYHEYPEVCIALSKAKAMLHVEPKTKTSFRIRLVLFWSKLNSIIAVVMVNSFVRLLAAVGVVLVLLNMGSIMMDIGVIMLMILYAFALYKDNYTRWYFTISILVLIVGGFSTSVYLVLYQLLHIWQWLSIVLAVPAGIAISYFFGGALVPQILKKLHKPSFSKCVGIFCSFFMITFGIVYLLLAETPFAETASSALSFVKSNHWLFYPIWFAFAMFLGSVFATVYSRAVFLESAWYREWNQASESRFSFGMTVTYFSVGLVLELIFYVPFVREYISSTIHNAIIISQPITTHLLEFALFYAAVGILAIPAYHILIGIVNGITRKVRCSMFTRTVTFLSAYCLLTYLGGIVVPGFLAFQNLIFHFS